MKLQEISGLDTQRVQEMNVLVSEAFGYLRPHHFLDDFPIWASPLAKVVRLGAIIGTKLVGHVGIRYAEMQIAGQSQKIAMIGAVATAAAHRGQGISSALMTEALKRIDASGCTWSLLWGSEHEYYAKFGFALAGEQVRAPVEKLSIGSVVPVSTTQPGMTEKIFQFLLHEKIGVKLTEADRAWVFSHKTIQWFSITEPFAFVGFERGLDLQHLIHTFGGDADALQSLFYAIYTHDKLVECLGTQEGLTRIGFAESVLIHESLCLARKAGGVDSAILPPRVWVSGVSSC